MTGTSQNRWRRQTALALSVVFGVLVVSCDERALPTQPTGLTITRVEPGSGPTNGTFPLMIHGTGFESGATVTLGGHTAAVTSVTPTSITATAPPHAPGAVDVVVTIPSGGRATLVGGLRYVPRPIPTPTPPLTVSGTVLGFRETGRWVPVPNLRLKVRADGPSFRIIDRTPLADTVTDADGRYTINDNSAFVLYFQTDPESEYRFLCDWSPLVTIEPLRELPVVHRTWSGNRPPPGFFGLESGAWGTVSELIDGSLQPVADATVILDAGIFEPPATTSPNGFYKICSTAGPDAQPRTVAAFKTGYNGDARDFQDYGDGIHLQLTRK
jgi:hypothetical protein